MATNKKEMIKYPKIKRMKKEMCQIKFPFLYGNVYQTNV